MPNRRLFLAALAASGLCSVSWSQKKHQKKPPDIQILKITSTRQEGKITYEGSFKVTSEKSIAGLRLHFEFLESRGVLLNIQRIQVEEAMLSPGEEKNFQLEGKDVPRAVSFRLSASDSSGRDLNIIGVGPYPLD